MRNLKQCLPKSSSRSKADSSKAQPCFKVVRDLGEGWSQVVVNKPENRHLKSKSNERPKESSASILHIDKSIVAKESRKSVILRLQTAIDVKLDNLPSVIEHG